MKTLSDEYRGVSKRNSGLRSKSAFEIHNGRFHSNLFLIIFVSRFEDTAGGEQFTDDMNQTHFEGFQDEVFLSPITGAPVINQDDDDDDGEFSDANIFIPNSIDDGEFLDTTADVSPNKLKHAMCGKLSVK